MKITLADQNHCTGCAACANICTQNAIHMSSDSEGFLQPSVDETRCVSCKKCEQICPVLHPQFSNRPITTCYAAWTEDSIRSISSTAGVFLLAARHTIQEQGVVFGAAWNDDWSVHHIGVNAEDQLHLLQGSKYLQSSVENSYRDARHALMAGKKVLYSGCPCQIAGLYAYLGNRSNENLTTMEIICHGVPSPLAFQKYLSDTFADSKNDIIDIQFRNKKKFGWSSSVTIQFKDKSTYQKNDREDSFLRGFLPCMILRRSCSTCPFSRLPRQADISLGDFWGIDQEDKSWDDRQGTEVILVNNEHGEAVFQRIIKPKLSRFQKFPLDAATRINKTILHPFNPHPGRKHFFSSMDLMDYSSLVENSLTHKYDYGIVGLWYGINYGSVLTYFSLYQLLRDLGYDPVMLPKPNTLWEERFNQPDSIAQRFVWDHCNVFMPYRIQSEYYRVNDQCKNFIVGSDVVWNYDICGKDSGQFFFLDWVERGHKKIAYAASFGQELSGPLEHKEKSRYYLRQFDALSVRELAGAEALKKDGIREDAAHVLDPVFVCDPQIYETLIHESLVLETEPTVFAYILRKSTGTHVQDFMKQACDYYHATARVCGNPNEMESSRRIFGDRLLPLLSVEDWLYHMKHCSFYIGDSYHALCFCLIFHKPFVIVYAQARRNFSAERFHSLLKLVGLENRFFYDFNQLAESDWLLKQEIDWDAVDEKLNHYRITSLNWLKKALAKDAAPLSEEDYIYNQEKRHAHEMAVKMTELEWAVDALQRELSDLKKVNASCEKPVGNRWQRGLRCIQEHGVGYTLKLFCKKIYHRVTPKE